MNLTVKFRGESSKHETLYGPTLIFSLPNAYEVCKITIDEDNFDIDEFTNMSNYCTYENQDSEEFSSCGIDDIIVSSNGTVTFVSFSEKNPIEMKFKINSSMLRSFRDMREYFLTK